MTEFIRWFSINYLAEYKEGLLNCHYNFNEPHYSQIVLRLRLFYTGFLQEISQKL